MNHKWHNWNYEQNNRRSWQDPEKILHGIGIKTGDTFIDIGCGDGYFAIPAARMVGKSGKVFGIDISGEAIERLQLKAKENQLDNIVLRVGAAENEVLCQECADFVFFGIDLHDFNDKNGVIGNAIQMLKPTGYLIDLDFVKENVPVGPSLQRKLSETEASELIETMGLKVVSLEKSEPYCYLLKARKPTISL